MNVLWKRIKSVHTTMVANYDNLGMPRASGIVTQLVNGEARYPDG